MMKLPPHLEFRGGTLHFEGVSLTGLAERVGTPTYVYSRAALIENLSAWQNACASRHARICYAMKANSNLAILQLFARRGAGFDIVSGGELERALAAGAPADRVLFSGVGKSAAELRRALTAGILCFNVESRGEIARLDAVAREAGHRARVSLRINPDVDARTHPYISTGLRENKFGIAFEEADEAYDEAASCTGLDVVGVDCHIGSQLISDDPLLEALEKLLELVARLRRRGIMIRHLDLGGGLGIRYDDEEPVTVASYLSRVFAHLDAWQATRPAEPPLELMFEPGRSIVGNAGILLSSVEYLKPGSAKNFAIVDAAMNDLMRPALYESWHGVVPVRDRGGDPMTWDIVGPVCESGDWLARDRTLDLRQGDLVAFLSAGAYGMSMASNYNTRARAAEVLVDGEDWHVIRERETFADLIARERMLGESHL